MSRTRCAVLPVVCDSSVVISRVLYSFVDVRREWRGRRARRCYFGGVSIKDVVVRASTSTFAPFSVGVSRFLGGKRVDVELPRGQLSAICASRGKMKCLPSEKYTRRSVLQAEKPETPLSLRSWLWSFAAVLKSGEEILVVTTFTKYP